MLRRNKMQEKHTNSCELQGISVERVAQVIDLQAFRQERDLEARARMLECENRYLSSICSNLIAAIADLRQRSRSR